MAAETTPAPNAIVDSVPVSPSARISSLPLHKNAAALSYDRRTMPAWQPLSMFCYAPAP